VRCAACGSWSRPQRHWASRNFFKCGSCGVLFLHPQPSEAELEQAYRTHYYVPGGDAKPVYENTPAALAWQLLRCLGKHYLVPPGGGRLLDFGCGIGDFAEAALHASLDVDAVEADPLARSVAEGRGIRVYGVLEGIPATRRADGYDLIALLDVLEHVREPVVLLGTLRKLLRREGTLYLSVPNYRSPQARILGSRWDQVTNPTHLFLFSAGSLKRALELAGFRLQYLPCLLRDPRFTPPGRLLSLSVQRLRLSATLRVIATAR
jgi:SAM-dependent methyltransferase